MTHIVNNSSIFRLQFFASNFRVWRQTKTFQRDFALWSSQDSYVTAVNYSTKVLIMFSGTSSYDSFMHTVKQGNHSNGYINSFVKGSGLHRLFYQCSLHRFQMERGSFTSCEIWRGVRLYVINSWPVLSSISDKRSYHGSARVLRIPCAYPTDTLAI